jgi:conjugative relaxase-like TrwC/TraI family protein
MLVTNPLDAAAATYYRLGPSPGCWAGHAAAALGLDGPVDPAALRRLLQGWHPEGRIRLRARSGGHPRAGWDLVFAAPKSVSLLVGVGPPGLARAVLDAHQAAVVDAMGWLETHACCARRSGAHAAALGVVAARFDHARSKAGDPHLHSHLVLANLTVDEDGRWSALDSNTLWTRRRGLSAVYDLGLRHQLRRAGIAGPWRATGTGTWDLDVVSPAARRAASRRGAELAALLSGRAEPTVAARRAARARSRAGPGDDRMAEMWRSVVAGLAGGGLAVPELPLGGPSGPAGQRPSRPADEAAPALGPDRVVGDGGGLGSETAVTEWLLERRSTFRSDDVLAALAATSATGAAPADAQAWAERYCERAVATAEGRVTSRAAAALDARIAARVRPVGPGHALRVDGVARVLSERPELTAAGTGMCEALDVLVARDGRAYRLDPPGWGRGRREHFVHQAALLDAARLAWQRAGLDVVVLTPPVAASRWRTLTGLAPPRAAARPDVVVLDRADRLAGPQLDAVVDRVAALGATLVAVRGGTLPARARAVCEAFERFPALPPAELPPLRAPGRPEAVARAGRLAVYPGPYAAITGLVRQWAAAGDDHLLCGLGPAEVIALNETARAACRALGALDGPEVHLAGRAFAVGDRVVPLARRAGAPGSDGQVVGVDPVRRVITVRWSGGTETRVDAWLARAVGHGYALTPGGIGLRRCGVALLGDPADLADGGARVRLAAFVAPALPAPAHRADLSRDEGVLYLRQLAQDCEPSLATGGRRRRIGREGAGIGL